MKRKNSKGFSLVEIIVVVLIMGTITVVLAPRVINWVKEARRDKDVLNYTSLVSTAHAARLDNSAAALINSDGYVIAMKKTGSELYRLSDLTNAGGKVGINAGAVAIPQTEGNAVYNALWNQDPEWSDVSIRDEAAPDGAFFLILMKNSGIVEFSGIYFPTEDSTYYGGVPYTDDLVTQTAGPIYVPSPVTPEPSPSITETPSGPVTEPPTEAPTETPTPTPGPVVGVSLNETSINIQLDSTYQLIPTISPEDAADKSVSWNSSDSSTVSVADDGTITGNKLGTATITVTTKDGGYTATCEVTVTNVKATGIAADPAGSVNTTIFVGESVTLSAVATPEKAEQVFDWAIVSGEEFGGEFVELNGSTVTGKKAGEAKISATTRDGSNKSVTFTIKVEKVKVASVTLDEHSISLGIKPGSNTKKLNPTIGPDNLADEDKAILWRSTDPAVAEVNSSGFVTAKKDGTATIVAYSKTDESKLDSCEVTVTVKKVESINGVPASLDMMVGEEKTVSVTVNPSDADNSVLEWTSLDPAVATVDAGGHIKAVKEGIITITVEATDGSGVSASFSLEVKKKVVKVTSITLNKTEVWLEKKNKTATLTATVKPDTATEKGVTWSTSNPTVATVDANGIVTAKKNGVATITATAKDGSGVSASCTVTVGKKITRITLTPPGGELKVGDTGKKVTAAIEPNDAVNKTLAWSSNNEDVATVSSDGTLTLLKAGTATITAKATDGSNKSGSCTITVKPTVQSVSLSETSITVDTNGTKKLTATVLPKEAKQDVKWSSSDNSIATVDDDGNVRGVKAGKATITVETVEGKKTASCAVEVKDVKVSMITLDQTNVNLDIGFLANHPSSLQLHVTIGPENATNKNLIWESSNTRVVTVDSEGIITAKSEGSAIITVRAVDGSNTMAQCLVNVEDSSCLVAGTLITMADGTAKKVEDIQPGDLVLVWNLYTGKNDVAPILFNDSEPLGEYEVISATFSDGTVIDMVDEHGFFDLDLGEYVYFREDAAKYIGHRYVKYSGMDEWTEVTLVDVVVENRLVELYSPVSFEHMCIYANDMLSMPGILTGLINIFDVDVENMKYDSEAMERDIAEYGLFTYDDFKELIPEEIYQAFDGKNLKVALAKGLLNFEKIEMLVERYSPFWE